MIAQDPTKHPGSIIRIIDKKIPKDNPKFKGKKTEAWDIPNRRRNPQGMDLSPFDNKIYITIMEQKEEIGLASVTGENYGWYLG